MTTSSAAKNIIVITISLLRSSMRRSFHAMRAAWRRRDMTRALGGVLVVEVLEALVRVRVAALLDNEAATPQDRDVVGATRDRFEIVRDDHDDRARRLELSELRPEREGTAAVEAG